MRNSSYFPLKHQREIFRPPHSFSGQRMKKADHRGYYKICGISFMARCGVNYSIYPHILRGNLHFPAHIRQSHSGVGVLKAMGKELFNLPTLTT